MPVPREKSSKIQRAHRRITKRFTRWRESRGQLLATFVSLGDLCARSLKRAEDYLKIETGLPTLTMSFTRAASQFAVRMQPWLAARPIVSGLFVP